MVGGEDAEARADGGVLDGGEGRGDFGDGLEVACAVGAEGEEGAGVVGGGCGVVAGVGGGNGGEVGVGAVGGDEDVAQGGDLGVCAVVGPVEEAGVVVDGPEGGPRGGGEEVGSEGFGASRVGGGDVGWRRSRDCEVAEVDEVVAREVRWLGAVRI